MHNYNVNVAYETKSHCNLRTASACVSLVVHSTTQSSSSESVANSLIFRVPSTCFVSTLATWPDQVMDSVRSNTASFLPALRIDTLACMLRSDFEQGCRLKQSPTKLFKLYCTTEYQSTGSSGCTQPANSA